MHGLRALTPQYGDTPTLYAADECEGRIRVAQDRTSWQVYYDPARGELLWRPYPAPTAKTKATAHMTTDSSARKESPIATGCLDYFPDALAEVARLSKIGNDKHNPGEPLHWSREKSNDHADCIMRHMLDRGTRDTDGLLHDAKVAWRALAMLQLALEKQKVSP